MDARKAQAAAEAAMEKARMTSYLDFDDSDDDSAPLTGGLKFEKSAAEKAAETAFDDHCECLRLTTYTCDLSLSNDCFVLLGSLN